MENKLILQKLNQIEKLLVGTKEILTIDDLVNYTGFQKSSIYKLVHKNLIPYTKPGGKKLFFQKSKIDEWLLSNSSKSTEEIENEAISYSLKTKKA